MEGLWASAGCQPRGWRAAHYGACLLGTGGGFPGPERTDAQGLSCELSFKSAGSYLFKCGKKTGIRWESMYASWAITFVGYLQ